MQIVPTLTACLFLVSINVAPVRGVVMGVNIFVSESPGEQTLNDLVNNLSNEAMVVRGLSGRQQNSSMPSNNGNNGFKPPTAWVRTMLCIWFGSIGTVARRSISEP